MKRRYSLSIHIGTLFLILTTIVGAVLIGISTQHAEELLTGSARELSQENSKKLESTFQRSIAPVFSTLDFMAYSSFIDQSEAPSEKARWLSSMRLFFERQRSLVALYFGNENGDFTIIRPLFSSEARKRVNAPDDAVLFVNHTKMDGTNEYIFLNKELGQVGYTDYNNNQFDPRTRPWFKSAQQDDVIGLTEPYIFYLFQTPGITLSRRSADGLKVVGADFTLNSLSQELSQIGYSKNAKLALFDHQFQVLAQHNTSLNINDDGEATKKKLESSIFSSVANRISSSTIYNSVEKNGESWSVTLTPVALTPQVHLLLADATPQNDLIANLLSMRNKQIQAAAGLMLICFAPLWFISSRLAKPLVTLMELTHNIARFDFKKTRYPKSMIKEVANLTKSIELMEHTLHDLLRLLRETASNQDFGILAKTVTHQSYLVTRAETIQLYTYSPEKATFTNVADHAIIPFKIDLNKLVSDTPWLMAELNNGETVHLRRNDNLLRQYHDQLFNSDIYFFPLLNRQRQLVGLLNLGYERSITAEQSDKHAFLRELLSFAEIAKDNIDKIQQQKDMLNAFVTLTASAIDTKSPYTGGHCQRVPVLTKIIAEAAERDKHYYRDFSLTKQEWEELSLASWLHDCGKVTTPEYVVDKSTKLETIYDRIHEVRMRFELLKTQAESDYWQGVSEGGDPAELKSTMETTQRDLDEEFEFVAKCNIGGEFMSDEDVERLKAISTRQWKRTIDDQLGISWIELQRAGDKQPLPVMENILADKPVHEVPWESSHNPKNTWKEEFVLQPGDYQYNRGELYNLSIRGGTLNTEERFIINDHIIQTITMLQSLPYPEHLKNVPDIAGGHHERMDGKGYPRGLSEEDLSIQARIMAIADVFEALTSNDRPYKQAKTIEESIAIMTRMATSGHIDPKLYLLFLEQELYQKYADMFLEKFQHSDIDKEEHIKTVKAYMKQQF